MNEILTEKELKNKYSILENEGGGDCLFLAISQMDNKYNEVTLRKHVCSYWKKLKKENKDYYNLLELSGDLIDDDGTYHDKSICYKGVWGSETDVALISEILNRKIIIYSRITNKKTYDGKKNSNYNKYTRLHEKSPGDIFSNNKKIKNDPIYLKLKITSNYGHFEAMIKNNTTSTSSNSTSSNSTSSNSTSSKSSKIIYNKSRKKKQSNRISRKKLNSLSTQKTKTKTKKTKKSPLTYSLTNDEYEDLKIAINNSLLSHQSKSK